jgi:hypothetical protein
MRIRVSDPEHVPALLAFLQRRPDCIVKRAGKSQIDVSLLGSRDVDANVVELEERLQPWRATNAHVRVELLEAH